MSKRITSILLVLVLVFALGVFSAYADEPDKAETYGLDVSFLRKDLNVADGVDISTVNQFVFEFASLKDSEGADSPAIANQTVTVGAQENDLATGAICLGDFITIGMFSHAGEYSWTVTEKQDTPAAPAANNAVLTMDQSSYTLRVYVINGADGKLAFDGLTVEKNGAKVDPTETPTHQKSEFLFENTLKEVVDDALTVTKTISGTYGNKEKTFPVTVKIEIPSAKVASKDDVVVAEGATVTWTSDTTATVTANLADGGKIEFKKLPAGTTFTVSEKQASEYKSMITGSVKTEDTAYVAGDRTDVAGNGPIVKKEAVSIDNQRDDLVPTGVIIDNLPYVLLVLVAVAGVAYLALKKKAYNA